MKVSELIEELKALDPDMEVIVQKDSEGNGYSPLAGVDPGAIYVADSTWSGEVYEAELTADEVCMEEDDWQEILKMPRALILYPVN
jgi:hypothetical protein